MAVRVLFILTMLLASLASSAVSVHAQIWRLQPRVQREIQSDISELSRQIERGVERNIVSRRDAIALRRDTAELERVFGRFSRDGLDRREVEQLESKVNGLRTRLKLERRNWTRSDRPRAPRPLR